MRYPKVLFLIDTLEVGGAEQSLLHILQRFPNVQPLVCTLYSGDKLKLQYEAAGIPVLSLGLRGRYRFGAGIRRVRHVVKAEKPDLIHATLYRAGIVARAVGKITGTPVIDSFVNDSYAPERYASLSNSGKAKLKAIELVDRVTAPAVTRFMSITEAIKATNCEALNVPPGKVDVIYRGRSAEAFAAPDVECIADLRRELRIEPGAPVLLNVARLLERKGQQDLLRAMPAVLAHHPEARLLIAGEGGFRARLEREIVELGLQQSVTLLGYRRDIADLLALADVFVFPSHWEGQGGALVEALFSSTPIVAADTPVHRESVTHGTMGRLFPVGNPEAIAAEVVWLLDRPEERARYGAAARAAAEGRFDIQRIAEQHEEFYRRVLSEVQR